MKKILIADDNETIRRSLAGILETGGFITLQAESATKALDIFNAESPVAAILDLRMPDMHGIDVLKQIKKNSPDVPVVILTAFGEVETAVEAMKLGAYDFIVKPPEPDRLILTINRAVENRELARSLKRLHTAVDISFENILGESSSIRSAISRIRQVAPTDFSVIIEGETGTGKSLAARYIHNLSNRAKGPFVSIDMSALPESLIESEMFGYVKGSFTGAERNKQGYFGTGNGGTILIDDLQNISAYVQGKLLKSMEERKIYPVGSTVATDVDIRLICTTNIDMRKMVREKKFREDLYFRLGEFMITLPPLRKRTEDILPLAGRFIAETCSDLKSPPCAIDREASKILLEHPWPGNVRELRNVIKRAVLHANGGQIRRQHIEFLDGNGACGIPESSSGSLREIASAAAAKAEEAAIARVLKISNGNKSMAAKLLATDYKTLLSKIKKFGIVIEK